MKNAGLKVLTVIIAVSLISLSGCAGKMKPQKTPDFYPNQYYQKMGKAQAQADVRECMGLADHYVQEPDRWKEAAKGGVKGGALGAGTGAIAGAIMKGKVGRATAAGAAVGGIVGIYRELDKMGEHSPSYERFVEHCLQKKGYEIIGWS